MTDATQPPPDASKKPDPVDELHERLGPQLEQAQAQLSELNERAKAFIRENPGTTLLGAAAIGFLIGRWASRR
jgi:ElaB/YqjD/DUF883 family membrane-anchored ribosome-binding protein